MPRRLRFDPLAIPEHSITMTTLIIRGAIIGPISIRGYKPRFLKSSHLVTMNRSNEVSRERNKDTRAEIMLVQKENMGKKMKDQELCLLIK